ncbi:ROK family protein [Tessaracoccus oleiagri]|uniref:Glucokinase n=1 Tax=Tessaracoccus oleiagri TaxID=686624 RepID=A0A1G9HX93_9ACTN|nr:ROK family protein [Tessaracoccus oleiagri]SDL17581.1 glucokinase [Tessaracoccus oleiagri]
MSVLALDIGGTKIAAGIVDGGVATHLAQVPTPSQEGPTAIMDAAWQLADRVRCGADGAPSRLAVASAGVIDPLRGFVTSATDALRDWAGTDLRSGMDARSGLPVSVLNDVHAHTWGEYRHGRGRGHDSMLLIAVGTGIGGGYVVDGQLALGSAYVAGHVGHVDVAAADGIACSCGRTGHLEGVASGTGIEQRFLAATGEPRRGGEVARLATTDEPLSDAARAVITTAGHSLGRAIGGMLNSLDPGLVVLAGSVARAGDLWWDAVHRGVAESAMTIVADTPIVPADLDNAALVGVAAWSNAKEEQK